MRIAVNAEFSQLVKGLEAAERALAHGGQLAVVTFHSLEDRIVKRFMQSRAKTEDGGSSYAPAQVVEAPRFTLVTKRAVGPDDEELALNPRSRSAKLRVARRTDAVAGSVDPDALAVPRLPVKGGR